MHSEATMPAVRPLLLAIGLLAALPNVAQAGMPSITLTDVARMRLDAISFFAVGFLISSWLIQRVWNYLGRDFAFLPRLSYGKALGLVGLWGLLFILVLTMISGARELLTPGAWEKQGLTYRLAKEPTPAAESTEDEMPRKEQLVKLRDALWAYAKSHQGKFPPSRTDPAIAAKLWQVPDPSGLEYVYLGGTISANPVPVALEPELYGQAIWVLMSDGGIRRMLGDEARLAVPLEKQ
jgi:hypothetical protein